ncbi:MAG: hypothetical protein JXB62_08295 [Pirellulales bacterium]|nr:hypothetical protein [Pirellulales bacterium]
MADCSTRISREHFISHSLIREIEKTSLPGERIRIEGFPWQTGGRLHEVSPTVLASKVLCERHNNLLSPLDSIGGSLFRAFHQIHTDFHSNPRPRQYYLFNGHDIERWLLKTLLGVIASGNTTNIPRQSRPPKHYFDCLFHAERLPASWGLYLLTREGRCQASGGVKVATIANGQIVDGLLVEILALRFILAIHAVPEKSGLLADSVNRPDCLHFCSAESKKQAAILLGWDIQRDGGTVEITAGLDR